MDVKIVPKISIDKSKCERVGEFLYWKDRDAIYFEGNYPFPVQLMVEKNLSIVQVTPIFLRLPFILRGWINFDILLREIDLLKFVVEGKLFLHASCVGNTLIVGFPNSGKTYQTYKMVREGGLFISEEYTIIDGIKAFPYKSKARSCLSARTIRDCQLNITVKELLMLGITTLRAKLMPFMFEPVIWKEYQLHGGGSDIKKILLGSTGEEVRSWKDLAIYTENEFPFMDNALLQAYAIKGKFDLITLQEMQRNLIRKFVNTIYG